MTQTITINLEGKMAEEIQRKSDIQIQIRGNSLKVTGIPHKDVVEYVAIDAETKSKFYVVHRPKENWNYPDFRLHVGSENELRETKVEKVERYRDGGTTVIDYVLAGIPGALRFPTPFERDKKPTDNYKGRIIELERLFF